MKYKSYEQFLSEMDRSEEIEKDTVDMGKPEEHEEEEAETVQANESEDTNTEEVEEMVSEILEKCYEKVVKEAKKWESDAHDDHTIESYMCENAALVAGLAAKSLKVCKEQFGIEAYESALNMISEAFVNKIEEVKLSDAGKNPEYGDDEPSVD
jgi:hypothetical protein